MNITKTTTLSYLIGLILIFCLASLSSNVSAEEGVPTPYQIDDQGRVDIYTHVGWRVFNLSCYVCHGVDATGTEIAPDLRESLKTMDKKEFLTKVLTRYRMTVQLPAFKSNKQAMREQIIAEVMSQERAVHGKIIMPAWTQNPYVEPHISDLYAYLKARSDEVIGPGEPPVVQLVD